MKGKTKILKLVIPLLALSPCALSLAWGEETPTIAILSSGKQNAYQEVIQGFTEAAPELKSANYDLGGTPENQDSVLKSIRSGPAPLAILAIGSQATELVQKHFPEVPGVYCMVFNPERYQASGGNLTGITLKIKARDQLEIFKKSLPSIKKIGVIYDPDQNRSTLEEANAAARDLGLILVEKKIRSQKEIANAIKELMWIVDALWMIPDTTLVSKESFQYLLQTSIDRRIPLFAFAENFVKGGALLALAPNYQDIGRQAVGLIQKILSGKSPQNLPPLSPEGHLILNLNTAKALNIILPPEILKKSDKIF